MLKRLYLNNCFRHNDVTFDFSRGLTGIIGQNEAGKSLIVEMIRYSLFGSAALRGKAEDYKKLHTELDFTVNGEDFTVVRKGSKCELSGARQASGTKPVNEAIRSILGYGLDVFDVANACNQGNVEALSSMTPQARRTMVDKTIGLNVLDDLISYCGTEANAYRRTAEGLKARLAEPVAPEKPEGLKEIQPTTQLEADVREFNQLKGWLASRPAAPIEPAPCPITDEVEDYQADRQQIIAANRRIDQQLAGLKPEPLSLEVIEEREAEVALWARKQQRDRLLAQGHLCCPACKHEWPVAGDALKAFEDLPPVMTPPAFSQAELNKLRGMIGNSARIAELEGQRQEVPEDRSSELDRLVQHRAQVRAYAAAKVAFDAYHAQAAGKQERLHELEGCEARLREVQQDNAAAKDYGSKVDRYNCEVERYNSEMKAVEAAEGKAVEYQRGRELLMALKTSVKSHLLPSLNKVASALLAQMTGGERFKVEVSEDFEITIDDQGIGTLSGSGKAVANLAIRIALGQILTNRVFSVFLADEVDAAMDDERAGYTAEALRRLKDTVQQVILVTHKRPETDHLFELRK